MPRHVTPQSTLPETGQLEFLLEVLRSLGPGLGLRLDPLLDRLETPR